MLFITYYNLYFLYLFLLAMLGNRQAKDDWKE